MDFSQLPMLGFAPNVPRPNTQLDQLKLLLDLQQRDYRAPEVSGQLTAPFAGGELGLRGQYQHGAPLMQGSPFFGAMLNYQRRF
jgi:hypothetical protein